MSDEWGYSLERPIAVGGGIPFGAYNERAYLNQMRGPAGQVVHYSRLGSDFGTHNPVDVYEVSYEGLAAPVHLYFDMYAAPSSFAVAPKGFTLAL